MLIFRNFRQVDRNLHGRRKELLGHVLEPAQVALAYPLQHKAVGGDEPEVMVGLVAVFKAQRFDPGIELLWGEFLLELLKAGRPKIVHFLIVLFVRLHVSYMTNVALRENL